LPLYPHPTTMTTMVVAMRREKGEVLLLPLCRPRLFHRGTAMAATPTTTTVLL
jgi:hypothetical protein